MPSVLTFVRSAALLASTVAAQNFRVIGQIYSGTPGETYNYRTWYGDGNMYIGPKIPANLENTLNFTIPDWTGTQPHVLVGPVAPATTEDLPEGTFMAVNNATGATDPLIFTNDESSLGEGYISEWIRYGTFLLPQNPEGASSTVSNFYLGETEEADTFVVTWRALGTPVDGLQQINLTAIL